MADRVRGLNGPAPSNGCQSCQKAMERSTPSRTVSDTPMMALVTAPAEVPAKTSTSSSSPG